MPIFSRTSGSLPEHTHSSSSQGGETLRAPILRPRAGLTRAAVIADVDGNTMSGIEANAGLALAGLWQADNTGRNLLMTSTGVLRLQNDRWWVLLD